MKGFDTFKNALTFETKRLCVCSVLNKLTQFI